MAPQKRGRKTSEKTPKGIDRSLVEYDEKLSAMSAYDREMAVLAVKSKAKIVKCLSGKSPLSLVKKFSNRASEVAQLIESRFSSDEKTRLADAQHEVEEAIDKAIRAGIPRAFFRFAWDAEREAKTMEQEEFHRKMAEMRPINISIKAALLPSYKEGKMVEAKVTKSGKTIKDIFNPGLPSYKEGKMVEAKWLYRNAAETGDSDSYLHLGRIAEDLSRSNMEEAKFAYGKAAEAGAPQAFFALGLIAQDESRTEEAMKYYKKASEMGVSEAQKALENLAKELIEKNKP